MKVTIVPGPEKETDAAEPVCISAVMVYQDVACASRAKAALDRVMSRLPFDGVCSLDLWPFELLDYPLFKREAAERAARSDVIALSLRGDQPLPPAVKSWLELWLSQENREGQALAVLMDKGQRNAPAVMDTVLRLYRSSQQGGVDMFLGFEETNSAIGRAISTRLPATPERGFPLPIEAVRRLEGCRHSLAVS